MPERCRKRLFENEMFRLCGGVMIEVESTDEGGRKVVDFICKRCGDHTHAPLVVHDPQNQPDDGPEAA